MAAGTERDPGPSASSGRSTVAVIPARGGSKGVPGKNLRRVGGRTLIARAVEACRASASVDAVFVTTDDLGIAVAAVEAGAAVIARPAELAGDTASSESALLDALDQLETLDRRGGSALVADILVFVQCTSPFIDPRDLDRAVAMVAAGEAETVFAAVSTDEFLWRTDGARPLVGGLNHHPDLRPRRQDRSPDYRETGAFYVMGTQGFRSQRHRFFGRTAVVEVAALSAVEIDCENDLLVANALAPIVDPVLVDG